MNGVLRGAIRRRGELAEPQDLATRYSHPQPLVELLAGEMGPEELEGVLAADNQAPETVLQGNPLAGDWSQIPAAIQAAGGSCTPHPWLERCFLIAGAGNLERLEIYQKGLCYVQDAASRLAVQCAGVKPGMQVLDSCAAPGGKSFAAAIDMAGQGNLIACDIHEHKLELIAENAARLGMKSVKALQNDALQLRSEWLGVFDRVLVDAPCSGLGVLRRRAEARWRKQRKDLKLFPPLQLAILKNAAQYVKDGGTMVYSTCTIEQSENHYLVEEFLTQHPEWQRVEFTHPLTGEQVQELQLLPQNDGIDGFYICKLMKKQ